MSSSLVRVAVLAAALLGADAARADFVGTLQPDPIAASTSVAFQNSNVLAGTTTPDGVYNFLDKWNFTLDGSFLVSSIAAAIAFTDAGGQAVLAGITNLQLNLVSNPPSGAPLAVWTTVSAPTSGLLQTVSLVPSSQLGAGSYTLEVRGDVTQPGSYAGSILALPVQPVPLPPTEALFASALLAVGFTASRLRRR